MRLSLLLAGLLLSGVLASAQENTPKIEVGASYSFVRTNSQRHFNENGGSGYIEYNLNRAFGLVADLGGYTNGSNRFQSFSYLFGPALTCGWGVSLPTLNLYSEACTPGRTHRLGAHLFQLLRTPSPPPRA
jgi:hypothetical protein